MPQQGYITVKLLPERTHETHRLIQQNVEKLYGPVEVYRQYLGECHAESVCLEDIERDNLIMQYVPVVQTLTFGTFVSFVWHLSFVKTFTHSTLLIFIQNHTVWKILREITLVSIMRYVPVVQTLTFGTFMSFVWYLHL